MDLDMGTGNTHKIKWVRARHKTKTLSSTTNDAGKQKMIWFFSYSVGKQNQHSCDVCNKVFTSNKALNGHMICHSPTAASSSSAQSYDDHFLPPKKRQVLRRRSYMNNDDDAIAAETLLHISHGGFETPQDCKEPSASNQSIDEKKMNEGETELGSKVVKNFDLNELPSNDVMNFELSSDDVKNLDLNEFSSDDCEDETN
ncbi:C2H2 type zf-met: zinc-finger protein [Medicago truncatula]|uniref:C2H2 type zf-met: zinc-finger protein n=1 Tax=Medicago truncatula TaxID=3880 RepID=A0A072VVR0_MEDTR|nr:C2H2 type zf-met: zinc-finger protein [Medicago truncatula]